jgi:hypothetical protein
MRGGKGRLKTKSIGLRDFHGVEVRADGLAVECSLLSARRRTVREQRFAAESRAITTAYYGGDQLLYFDFV